MNIEKIKKALLKIRPSRGSCAGCGHKGTCLYTGCKIINEAVGTLDELKEELRSEMHRHDRLQDFEVAEAQELAKYKAERCWIPVAEGLPELKPCGAGTAYSEAVNVLTSGRKVLTAIWDGTDFISDAEFWEAEGEAITHWTPVLLPLPEPPKEGTV